MVGGPQLPSDAIDEIVGAVGPEALASEPFVRSCEPVSNSQAHSGTREEVGVAQPVAGRGEVDVGEPVTEQLLP